MKRLLLFLLVLTGGGVHAQTPANLRIEVNEGIELLSVIQYLGGRLNNNTLSPYHEDVQRYFLRYRGEPAVETMFLYKRVVYPDLVECGLVFDHFPDIRMHQLPDSSHWHGLMGSDSLNHYLTQCIQFYKDTHFHEFYKAHEAMYRQWAQGLRDSISEPIRIFDSLINTRRDHHWLVFMDPLNDWGAHTVEPDNVNMQYRNYFIYQLGYFGDTDRLGRMTFAADLYDFAWHEGTHAFTDSLLKKWAPSIDSLAGLFPPGEALQRQNVNDWEHYFNELLPRAVSSALHRQFRSESAYEELIKKEENRGFIHVREVSEVIYADFIHERKVDSFEALLPRIFKALRALPKSRTSPGT
jgi:hypothetical protein